MILRCAERLSEHAARRVNERHRLDPVDRVKSAQDLARFSGSFER
jgi:hypothetical protein